MATRRTRSRPPTRRRRKPRRADLLVRARRPALILAALAGLVLIGLGLHQLAKPPTRDQRRALTMAQARAANAAIPFADGPLDAARPFVFHGTPAARLQATECLATVAIYEAGDDAAAQRAVIQVVLNRVGQPGFAKTVCGVVYQGAGLKTGCQFSFTCDDSVHRRTEHRGWPAARALARHALAGAVDEEVGTATHYHADWMVPYWIDSLDKIAQVKGHIFYRRKQGQPPPAGGWFTS